MENNGFLPINQKECQARGWDRPDFVYVTGDAYVDHPSFGVAIISRVLESRGYKVAILSQPDYKSPDAFREFGRPRLGFLVTAGNIDSMVAHYTAAKRRRSYDYYSPGGKMGLRPDRAVIVYANRIREAYGDVPIILGGLEASLRRFAHYDYWDDKVRRSVLVDSRADILTYGMGENILIRLADLLDRGIPVKKIHDVRGTVYLTTPDDAPHFEVASTFDYNLLKTDKRAYAEAFGIQYKNQDAINGKAICELYDGKMLVQNPPMPPLEREELDAVYDLPYMRTYHPSYEKDGGVPAIEEVRFSVTHNRGCFGGCNFCALAFHQGRTVRSRSIESVLKEAEIITQMPDFKGYIHDIGGPTANFRSPACDKQLTSGVCSERKCLAPKPCKNLKVDHREYLELIERVEALPKVKKVFIRSGIRFDYLMLDPDKSFFKKLVKDNVSGQLKVAPEHCSNPVLRAMGKPDFSVYEDFRREFFAFSEACGKEQYLVPYLMSSHPGSTLKDAVNLALCLKRDRYAPEQVQDYYPTPGTASTVMYYTGINPLDGKPVYVVTDYHEKLMQRALLQYNRPENADLVREALKLAGREDLIGFGDECLVRPKGKNAQNQPAHPQKGTHQGHPATVKPYRAGDKSARPGSGKTDSAKAKVSTRTESKTQGEKTESRFGKEWKGTKKRTSGTREKTAKGQSFFGRESFGIKNQRNFSHAAKGEDKKMFEKTNDRTRNRSASASQSKTYHSASAFKKPKKSK